MTVSLTENKWKKTLRYKIKMKHLIEAELNLTSYEIVSNYLPGNLAQVKLRMDVLTYKGRSDICLTLVSKGFRRRIDKS